VCASVTALLAAAFGFSACASLSTDARGLGDEIKVDDSITRLEDAAVDAGITAPSSPLIGSPLCRQSVGTCNPDSRAGCTPAVVVGGESGRDASVKDAACTDSAASDAAPGSRDASANADSAGLPPEGPQACRAKTGAVPRCESAGASNDGDACSATADCAAGLACVRTKEAAGVCRATCCNGSCESQVNGTKSACVLGPVMGSAAPLPVCLGVRACQLLGKGDCGQGETCAVVRQDGTTGCIAAGPQAVGDSCELANCAAGSVCLGEFGQRTCLQLCREGELPCPDGRRCVWGAPLLPIPKTGVCVGSSM
jgi:hypothetical protein